MRAGEAVLASVDRSARVAGVEADRPRQCRARRPAGRAPARRRARSRAPARGRSAGRRASSSSRAAPADRSRARTKTPRNRVPIQKVSLVVERQRARLQRIGQAVDHDARHGGRRAPCRQRWFGGATQGGPRRPARTCAAARRRRAGKSIRLAVPQCQARLGRDGRRNRRPTRRRRVRRRPRRTPHARRRARRGPCVPGSARARRRARSPSRAPIQKPPALPNGRRIAAAGGARQRPSSGTSASPSTAPQPGVAGRRRCARRRSPPRFTTKSGSARPAGGSARIGPSRSTATPPTCMPTQSAAGAVRRQACAPSSRAGPTAPRRASAFAQRDAVHAAEPGRRPRLPTTVHRLAGRDPPSSFDQGEAPRANASGSKATSPRSVDDAAPVGPRLRVHRLGRRLAGRRRAHHDLAPRTATSGNAPRKQLHAPARAIACTSHVRCSDFQIGSNARRRRVGVGAAADPLRVTAEQRAVGRERAQSRSRRRRGAARRCAPIRSAGRPSRRRPRAPCRRNGCRPRCGPPATR